MSSFITQKTITIFFRIFFGFDSISKYLGEKTDTQCKAIPRGGVNASTHAVSEGGGGGLRWSKEENKEWESGAYMESLPAYFAVATLSTCVSWAVLSWGRHLMWMISSSGSLRPLTKGKRSCRHNHIWNTNPNENLEGEQYAARLLLLSVFLLINLSYITTKTITTNPLQL